MSSTNTNSNNNDPDRGIRGGRGRGHGRRHGRGKKKRNRSGQRGGAPVRSTADSTKWMALESEYRDYLVKTGLAANATDFGKLEAQTLIAAYAGYRADVQKQVEIDLTKIVRMNMIAQMDPYEAISESHFSEKDSEEVRRASIAFYGLPSAKFCQILGEQPDQVKIVNAHIWPRSATASLPLFDLKPGDVHNPRNILRLQHCIERAFDRQELTFVADTNDQLVLKVLSKDLLKSTSPLRGTQKKFEDIDGAPLQVLNTEPNLPYRRLLAKHSVLAHRKAREKNWISDDMTGEEVNASTLMAHSLDSEAQDRLKLMWRNRVD